MGEGPENAGSDAASIGDDGDMRSGMRKRLKRWEVPGGVRFVTFSCQRRLPLFGHSRVRDVFAETLPRARARFGLSLYAWVIMPEHVHLLVRPGDGQKLERALRFIKLSVSNRVLPRWHELGAPILDEIDDGHGSPRFWQKGGGFDRNVRDLDEFCRTVRYIHRNPVRRELVERPEDWRHSSVRWWMGERYGEVECDPPPEPTIGWHLWQGYK